MNFETKLMRSLKNSKKFVRSMNSGAFKELSVYFGFSTNGVRENYRLSIVHSPEVFSVFGYGSKQNSARLFKQCTSNSFQSLDFFESEAFAEEVEKMRLELESSFTEQEIKQTMHDYEVAATIFARDMGWIA